MSRCPAWCVTDHTRLGDPGTHFGATQVIAVRLEGRGHGGPHDAELVVEVSRRRGEAAVWVYLGDGWTGFSLSLESATRVSAALSALVSAAAGGSGLRGKR